MGVALSGQRRRDLEAMHGAVYKSSGIFYRARGHYAFQIFPTWQVFRQGLVTVPFWEY